MEISIEHKNALEALYKKNRAQFCEAILLITHVGARTLAKDEGESFGMKEESVTCAKEILKAVGYPDPWPHKSFACLYDIIRFVEDGDIFKKNS